MRASAAESEREVAMNWNAAVKVRWKFASRDVCDRSTSCSLSKTLLWLRGA
jgi:hypothetical protein